MHLPLLSSCANAAILSLQARAASPTPAPIAQRGPVNEIKRPTPQRISVSNEKRDLTAEGQAKYLSPNGTSVYAACYQLYIEVFTPSSPRNLTAWYQRDGKWHYWLVHEWPRAGNPWVNENISISATWDRLTIKPGSLTSIIVQGYLNDVTESAPFTVQPSDDRTCYGDDWYGDASWGTTTGPGITTTFTSSAPQTRSRSGTTSRESNVANTYRPDDAVASNAVQSDSPDSQTTHKASITGPVVGGVLGALGVIGIALGIWFWLRRKRRASGLRDEKGGAATAGDEAPYVVDLVEDDSGTRPPAADFEGAGTDGRESPQPQVQAWTYGPSDSATEQRKSRFSSDTNARDSRVPFMSRGAASGEETRPSSARGVIQERDSGLHFPVDTVPPTYADATVASSSRSAHPSGPDFA